MCGTKPNTKGSGFRTKMREHHFSSPLLRGALEVLVMCMTPFIWLFSLIQDRVMMQFLNKVWLYNMSWEDPRIDQREFALTDTDHVLTIASAGCNVLDYMIEGAKVTAVDFNLCQIALLEIKAVAIQELEYDDFFEIFARSNMEMLRHHYQEKIRPHLSIKSAEFWDTGIFEIKSFMYSGTSGNAAWFLFRVIFPLLGLGWVRKLILKGVSAQEFQAEAYRHQYGMRAVAWLLDNLLIANGSILAGVPTRQLNLGMHRPNNLALVMDRVFFHSDMVHDNYFYAGYILGEYTKENCPRYLKQEHFQALRENLKLGKLQLFHGSIMDALEYSTEPVTVASLLDHMDWQTDKMINQEITLLLKKMDHSRGRVFWRSFSDNIHAAPLLWLNPRRVNDADDRVGMYFSTWIADLDQCEHAFEDRVESWSEWRQNLFSVLVTGAKMVTFPAWKYLVKGRLEQKGHAEDMEAFYKFQKEGYDEFREGLLHARPALMECFPLKKSGDMVWVDIGGGTARNLEFLPVNVIREYFKEIVIVDISKSLLEVAKTRIEEMNLQDIVRVVEHDCTAESVFEHLPKAGTVDVVTMSYSLSMIPDKRQALLNCMRVLKGDGQGVLGVADFFGTGNNEDMAPPLTRCFRAVETAFHKWWFANDHVFLLDTEVLEPVIQRCDLWWDDRFRGKVPFLPIWPHHGVFLGIKA